MEEPNSIVSVTRVTRNDTLQVRAYCPLTRARCEIPVVVAGVWCKEDSANHIVDWCEIHADAGRLKLMPYEYMRDEYGRLVADIADIQSGETLSAYLISVGVARARPNHMLEVMGRMIASREPDHDDG